jgi:hypothetical protein
MTEPGWMSSATAWPPPPTLHIRCRRCRRLMAKICWNPHRRAADIVDASYSAEGDLSGYTLSPPGVRRAARWWDHSAPGRNSGPGPSRYDPDRYGYDCRGRHRDSRGTVTVERLSELYLDATGRGERTVWLP